MKKENNEKININLDNQILNDIFTLPFSINKTDYTIVDSFRNKYEDNYPEFIAYFRTQWIPFFVNCILNYSYLKKNTSQIVIY